MTIYSFKFPAASAEARPQEHEQVPMTLSITEAATMLGISKSLAYELAAQGDLKTIRLGRRIVVPRHVIEQMLAV